MKGKTSHGPENSRNSRNFKKGFAPLAVFFVLALVAGGFVSYYAYQANPQPADNLQKFGSCSALSGALRETLQKANTYYTMQGVQGGAVRTFGGVGAPMVMAESASKDSAGAETNGATGVTYSETNVQVEGVDEADIVKTDGSYIYTVSSANANIYRYAYFREDLYTGGNSTLIIAKAYPSEEAAIVSETDLGDFYPQEMFINGNYVLIFGSTSKQVPYENSGQEPVLYEGVAGSGTPSSEGQTAPDSGASEKMIVPPYYQPYRYISLATVRIYDMADKASPQLVRSVDFEGSYLSSRKIGSYVYFIVNSYPDYYAVQASTGSGGIPEITDAAVQEMLPEFRDRKIGEISEDTNLTTACGCDEVAYFEPVNPQNFIIIASISMADPQAEVTKEVVMGSGQNVYASLSSLYIAETSYPFWMPYDEANPTQPTEKTLIHKFSLDNGKITHVGYMEAPGHILNQFSMDEYDNHFRIATTVGQTWSPTGQGSQSRNSVYIFADDLTMSGKLEDIAPGESIYSARFMGGRGYLVTFKKIDPFFVLDLSDHTNPRILGKLKIPGYSDYLHPYDENHIIGIGKEAFDAESQEGMPSDFAWYQGVKIALFDVTDVANPVEMHKVVIGDRGTDSYALQDHKAFLFDREKNLLVVPILLAELTDEQKNEKPDWGMPYGEYTYQGAYVYDLSLENGFVLKGRITHYEADDQTFMKSGYYYFGDEYSVKRSLYIDSILYTVSGMKIKLNSLDNLSEIKQLVFSSKPAG